MVGIICAMDVELELINKNIEYKEVMKYKSLVFTKGKINGKDVVSVVCGIGKVNAAMCAQIMIMLFSPDVIINSGVAGGLLPDLKVCDIVVADYLYEYDIDITPLGYPLGYIGIDEVTKMKADEGLVSVLCRISEKFSDINTIKGTIVTGDQFISDKDKKEYLIKTFGAAACEMEGGAIAHVCYMNNVPFAVLRAISDGASDGAELSFEKFVEKASQKLSSIITEFVEKI